MNMRPKFLTLCFAISMVFRAAMADDQPRIPAQAWKSYAAGVSLAITLTTHSKNGQQNGVMNVYVKNTAKTVRTCTFSGGDWGFRLYTMNHKGTWQYLQDYDDNVPSYQDIGPGKTLAFTIGIAPKEFILLKARPMKWGFYYSDPGVRLAKNGTWISYVDKVTEIPTSSPY